MAKVLILLTKSKTLGLLDGAQHPSGFWAEEFVVPYDRFVKEGYQIDVATIGGQTPSPDRGSLTVANVAATRPAGSVDHDVENIAHYTETIDTLDVLKAPMDVSAISKDDLARYDGIYISGGHGAMDDMPHDASMTRLVRWILELDKPLAVVCHGHSALLPLRDSESEWPLKGYRMTCFSHEEELVTDMAGLLPFVLQREVERLGAIYEKADLIWGSHVVVDRNVITGQNPYSSTELAEAFIKHLSAAQ